MILQHCSYVHVNGLSWKSLSCSTTRQVQSRSPFQEPVVSPPNSLFIRRRRTAARLRMLTIGTPACGEEEDKGVNFPVNFLKVIHTTVDNLNLLA